MAQSPIANVIEYGEDQDLGHVNINDATRKLEQTGYLVVEQRNVNDPTLVSLTDGEAVLVGSSPTGDFLGHDNEVAIRHSGWVFRALRDGEVFTSLGDGTNGTVYVNNGGTHVVVLAY